MGHGRQPRRHIGSRAIESRCLPPELLYVGFGRASASAVRAVVIVVGVLYVLMGLLAFADPTLFGLLPTGFTGFDIGFHLIVGLGALALALVPASRTTGTTAVGSDRR